MVYQTDSRQDTLIKSKATFLDESEQTVISSIKMFGANIEHSARNNYRPYLMLYGEISAVAFPNGRYQAFCPPTQMHVRYEFSDDELGQLATKGLFYDGFKCPDIISENPNIEIPMTATACRYEMNGNLYVSLDLASKGIYQTNTKDCEYVFANYFEEQIPSKLDTKPVEKEEDVIPTFDDDFAAQFAAEFEHADEDLNRNNEAFAKEAAQARNRQSNVSKAANDLLLKSPTYLREQARIKSEKKKNQAAQKNQPDKPISPIDIHHEPLEDDFAIFRREQQSQTNANQSKDIVQPFQGDKLPEYDPILSHDVEFTDTLGDLFDGQLDEAFYGSESSDTIPTETLTIQSESSHTKPKHSSEHDDVLVQENVPEQISETKESVEEALRNATSTKHNTNAQKLTVPEDESTLSDDIAYHNP